MMTKDEAINLLRGGKEGIQEWNRRRKAGEEIPSLIGANLGGVRLDIGYTQANAARKMQFALVRADLSNTNFSKANFTGAHLQYVNLEGADLSGANFAKADLAWANLSGAILRNTLLIQTNLNFLSVNGTTDLNGAVFGGTTVNCDLSIVKGMDRIQHCFESNVAINAILNFQGELPETFLRGCGIREEEIAYFRGVVGKPIRFYSCFISYSTADEELAMRLHNDFQAAGIRCWKWDHDARTGRSLWGEIDQAIRVHDKLVLIASESSLTSPAVNREIERAIVQEDERLKKKQSGEYDGDANVLFPVRVDDFIFDGWDHERKVDVTKKVIADATGWEKDNGKYQAVLARLIRDLKDEPKAP